MLTKVGIEINADAKKALRAFDEVAKKANAAQKAAQQLGEFTAGPVGLSIKFNAVAEAAQKAIQVLQQAAQVIDNVSQRAIQVNNVFGNLAFGIEGARKATRGMVTDFDLAVAANQAMSLGVTNNAKDFAELAGAAQALGARINQGPKESLDSLMTALGRGSTMMLDNLGIVLKETEAYDIYARQLGKTANQLDDNEKAEAFRKVAMQKVIEAAKGVTVETNNAASAVQRFKIEIQNIEDRALGAADKTASLRDTLRDYVMVNDVSIASVKAHGASVMELESAMADLGVSTSHLGKSSTEWVKLLQRAKMDAKLATDEFKRWGKSAEGIAQISKELNAIQTSAQAYARGIIDKDRLHDIERELALHGSQRGRMEQINALLNEKAELTAKQLELEGKLSEAEEVRFQNELRQISASVGRSGGGGRRRSQWEGTEIGSIGSRGSGIAMASDRADFQDQMSGVQMARAGQGAQQAQDDFKIKQLEERQARMNEFDKFANEQLENEKKRLEEEAEATKKAEEAKRKEIELTMRSRMEIASATQALTSQSAALAGFAAEAGIKGGKRREAAMKAIAGSELITIGIVETVKAVAAFAGFNYVEGALHVGAAALAYARGGQLLSQAGGSGGGGGPSGGFAGAAAFGGGGAADSGGATQSSTGGGDRPSSNGPISESEESVQRSGRGGRPGPTRNRDRDGAAPTVNLFHLGALDDGSLIKIDQGLAHIRRKSGRNSS